MTITLKPLHLVVIAFVAGLAIAGGAALALSGGDDGNGNTQAIVITVTPTSTAPTGVSTSDAAPTATAVPPTATPEPAPPAPEPAPPEIRTCAQIRASGTYLNDEERAFFLANCQNQPGQTTAGSGGGGGSGSASPNVPVPGPSSPAPDAVGISEAERAYRVKAQGATVAYLTRYQQYANTVSVGARADVMEFGAIAGGWANQMNNFAPIPPRFERAHFQLQAALRALDAHCRLIDGVQNAQQYQQWAGRFVTLAQAATIAMDDYFLVVGLDVN